MAGQANHGVAPAGWRLCGDHAVELPCCDDCAQGRGSACRGLHDGDQAIGVDAVLVALAVLAKRAGVPDDVLSVLTGDSKAIGDEFCANPLVKKLSFTGSTAVGKLLMQQCAGTVKWFSLELGGNAPFMALDDADFDAAVAGAIASKSRNAGQA